MRKKVFSLILLGFLINGCGTGESNEESSKIIIINKMLADINEVYIDNEDKNLLKGKVISLGSKRSFKVTPCDNDFFLKIGNIDRDYYHESVTTVYCGYNTEIILREKVYPLHSDIDIITPLENEEINETSK